MIETGETLVVLATHWPSRSTGRWRSEPLRIALAENVAYIVRDHVRFNAQEYLALKAAGDLAAVQARWETKVLIMGDLNDEPSDRSLVENLRASSELDRVVGPTNEIKGFANEVRDYRADDTFLFNASWKFLAGENTGTYFIDATRDETFANRYQVLDQIIVTRGLLDPTACTSTSGSVNIHTTKTVATQPRCARAGSTARPRRAPAITCRWRRPSTTDRHDPRTRRSTGARLRPVRPPDQPRAARRFPGADGPARRAVRVCFPSGPIRSATRPTR